MFVTHALKKAALRGGGAFSVTTSAARRRAFASSAAARGEIAKIGIVGMGSMGHGIAQLSAGAGYEVVAGDLDGAALSAAMGHIEGSLNKLASKTAAKAGTDEAEALAGAAEALARITATTDLGDVRDCDLVIEAIVENLPVKLDFYERLGALCGADTIFASNTSSFPITEMAEASGRPEKVCGLHYFNPVQIMKLCEIVHTEHTDKQVLEDVAAFVAKTGKVGVPCGDSPGFIVNRLLVPYIVQGVAMVARGDAKPDDIDLAMRLGAGYPMGPITLSDYVGNDINLAVMKGWVERFPDDPAFQVPEAMELLEEMVEKDLLGRKTGQGFFKWEGNKRV